MGRRTARVPHLRIGHATLRGELDARLIRRMVQTGLVPRARACFQPLLLKQRATEGTVSFTMELSRGEVTRVAIDHSDFSIDIGTCLLDAAYQLEVPRTVLDDLPDTVYVVHYPITFRSIADVDDQIILPGDADSSDPIDTGVHVDDADQPLGGLPAHP